MKIRRVTALADTYGEDITGDVVTMLENTIHLVPESEVEFYLDRPALFTVSAEIDIVTYARDGLGAIVGFMLPNGTIQAFGSGGSGSSASTLDELTDVVVTTPSAGQVIKFVGGQWVNANETAGTGEQGRGISSVTRTAGTGAAGTIDTYTITYTDATTSTFNVANGVNGATGAQGNAGANGAQGTAGAAGTNGTNGTNGLNGWSPVFSQVADGARRVLQIADWVGGTGTKPAVGSYISATGFTPTLANASDFRGEAGAGGGGGSGSSIPSQIAASATFTISDNTQVLFSEPIDILAGGMIDFGANTFLTQVN